MSENQSNEDKSQEALSELLDDALKDFDNSGEPATTSMTTSQTPAMDMDVDFLKESFEETMRSFMDNGQANLAVGLQEILMEQAGPDMKAVIQESLKNLSEAKQNLPEGSDMTSIFANMGLQDDVNLGEDMMPMLMQFMQPLLSKEVLYPSIKDLYEKYPKWLEDNEPTCNKEEFDRHLKVYGCVKEVKDHLESQQDTDDEITKMRKFKELMELLKKMQECGQPPEELLRDVADGNLLPENNGQCSIM